MIYFTGKLYTNLGEKKENKIKDDMSANFIYLTIRIVISC